MEQFVAFVKSREETRTAYEKAKAIEAELKPRTTLCIAYVGTTEKGGTERIQHMHRTYLPQAQLLGLRVDAAIANGKIAIQKNNSDISPGEGAVLSFLFFASSKARVRIYDQATESVGQIAGTILKHMRETERFRAMMVCSSRPWTGFETLMMRMRDGAKQHAVFFGGLLGDGQNRRPDEVFTAEGCYEDVLVTVCFSGEDLSCALRSSFGWHPLGHSVTVTRTSGPRRVIEVDERPALAAITHYLGGDKNWSDTDNRLHFLLSLTRNDILLGRYIQEIDGDDIILSGDIYTGEEVRLSCGDPSSIIEQANGMWEQLYDFVPEATLVTSCLGRQFLMQQETEKELAQLRNFPASAGFYSYVEYIGIKGSLSEANMTVVAVALREGEPKTGTARPALPKFSYGKKLNAMALLLRFVNVLTEEWEDAQKRLSELAETDALTGLANRRTMETVLRHSLDIARVTGQSISVLMLDLDNFKSINDLYGHEMGDRALQAVAEVLRSCTRSDADTVSRWGGDEFFVILMAGRQQAEEIAERIRHAVERCHVLPKGRSFTVSCGVHVVQPGMSQAQVFRNVDRALYSAKSQRGKNSIVIE